MNKIRTAIGKFRRDVNKYRNRLTMTISIMQEVGMQAVVELIMANDGLMSTGT